MPSHNFKNRIGERYGHLLVIEQAPNIITPNGRSHVAWKCLCDCGNEKIIRSDLLQNGSTKSCGCQAHGQRVIDETGNKYGKLTVLKRVGSDQDNKALWLCQCECGNTTITTGKRLRIGMVQSCGCIKSIKESEISKLLYKNNINFKREYHFSNLKDIQPLRFDFAIFNSCLQLIALIEYNGEQHYLNHARGKFTLEDIRKTQLHDQMKEEYCEKYNIPLLILNKDNYNEDMILEWINNIIRESEGEEPYGIN